MSEVESLGGTTGEEAGGRLERLRRSFDESIKEAPKAVDDDVEEFLITRLADEIFGLPVSHVLEIVKVPPIIRVPGLPSAILGIMNFRGRILSVTSMHELLDFEPTRETKAESRIIVTKNLSVATGLLVDQIESMAEVARNDVTPLPTTMDERRAELFCGQVRIGERLSFLIDMKEIERSKFLRAGAIEPAP